MAHRVRCTLFLNDVPGQGYAMAVPSGSQLAMFIKKASEKLGVQGKKLYLEDGGEIDDLDLIRDNDAVYLSCGEPFKGGIKARPAKGSVGAAVYSVAVMGPGSVGKSAMTLQYVQGVWVPSYDPTIEDAYRKATSVDGKHCQLDILDTAGQEDYTALRSTWMRERDGFILVFSIADASTFDNLQDFYNQLCVMHEDKVPPIVVAGNKADLESARVVLTKDGQRLADSWNAVAYVETSAKTGQNIEKAFTELVRAMRDRAAGSQAKKPAAKEKKWCILL